MTVRPPTLLAAALVLCGCFQYRATKHAPAHGATVRARFATPRDLTALTPGGDTVVLRGRLAVEGRVLSRTSPDTLHLDVLRRGAHVGFGIEIDRPQPLELRVALGPEVAIEEARFSARHTAAAVYAPYGVIGGLVAHYYLLVWLFGS